MKIKILCIIGLLLFVNSCKTTSRNEKNTYQIINMVIKEFGTPSVVSAKNLDINLKSKKSQLGFMTKNIQKVRVYPTIENKSYSISLNDHEEFDSLAKDLENPNCLSMIIDKNLLEKPNNYDLKLLDTIAYRKDRRYLEKNHLVMIRINNIIFNNDYTKALVIAGAARSHLAGFSSLVLYEKVNGIWKEVYSKTLEIS